MAKKPTILLPPGEAVYPHLNEVDVYQPVNKKGQPSGAEKRRYITYIRFTPEVLASVKEQIIAAGKLIGYEDGMKTPFKMIKTGEVDGKPVKEELLVAASGEKNRPPIFDAKKQSVPVKVIIGGGSTIRLDVTVSFYEGFGGGINLYINSVQLIKWVDGNRVKFEEVEGGFTYEASADEASDETSDHNEGEAGDYAL